MLPDFEGNGNLPSGIHWATWEEFCKRFGASAHRRRLIEGLCGALKQLREAGCSTVYINGSFVTAKETPADYDVCWDMQGVDVSRLDGVFLDFGNRRAAQKAKYFGEFFPAQFSEGLSGKAFMDFFQVDKDTGDQKGIIAIDLRSARL